MWLSASCTTAPTVIISVDGDREFGSQPSQTKNVSNVYLTLPSLAFDMNMIRSVSVYCGWVRSWCWHPDFLVRQHYKIIMCVHCHKSVPVLIWPLGLQEYKSARTKQPGTPCQTLYIHMLSRPDGRMNRASVSQFGRSENLSVVHSNAGWVKLDKHSPASQHGCRARLYKKKSGETAGKWMQNTNN